MAFVNEVISEKDRIDYGVDNIKHPHGSKWSQWTIDRALKSFLLSCGTDREGFHRFKFFYEGNVIAITAKESCKGNPKDGLFITYDISEISISEQVADRRDNIIKVFGWAIDEYGISGRKLPNCKVTITLLKKS